MLRGRRLGGIVAATLVVSVVLASAAVSSQLPAPRAFDRPAKATDALPSGFVPVLARFGKTTASRRIATYADGRGRKASLYLVKTSGRSTCLLSVGLGGGGAAGCSPSNAFIAANHYLTVGEHGRLVVGVVRANVDRVVVVGSRGVLHSVRLTRDGGFIYDCLAYNGCTSVVVSAVRAYNGSGRVLQTEVLP